MSIKRTLKNVVINSTLILIGTGAFIIYDSQNVVNGRPAPLRKSIDQLINDKALSYNLDPDLMRAVIDQESKFNPKARHKQLSAKDSTTDGIAGLNRAWGLCGIMGREAERRGVPWRTLEDPEVNLELCGAMLASCIESASGKTLAEKTIKGLACHYSGKPVLSDSRPRPGEPSPREYSEQVTEKYLNIKLTRGI